jgi:putative ABC transport system permease protein
LNCGNGRITVNFADMLRNYLIIAYRNLRRHKVFSLINISGLTLGLTTLCCITLYIIHEASYDTFHPHPDRTYRVIRTDSLFGPSVWQYNALAPAFRENIPEIETLARMEKAFRAVFRHKNEYFTEAEFYWADPELLQLFHLPFKYGNPVEALQEPNTLVLTERTAMKYFGRSNALGETLQLDTLTLTVTGVLADLPSNTHLSFTMLGSYRTLGKADNFWMHQGYMYVLTRRGTSPTDLEDKLTRQAHLVSGHWISTDRGTYQLQPLPQIHLHSVGYVGQTTGNEVRYLYIFGAIALIIALSTAFNYVNLATARYLHRAREVGVRKVVGASRRNLILQFLGESVLISLIALLLAITLLQLVLPLINRLFDVQLSREYSQQGPVLLCFLGLALLLGITAGIYPAFFITRFKPSQVLKGIGKVRGNWRVRETLIVLQFSITLTLLIATLTVQQQLDYAANKNLGFQKEQILVLYTSASAKLNAEPIRQRLRLIPQVERVAVSNGSPVQGSSYSYEDINGHKRKVYDFQVDEDFIETLGMQMVLGRNFSNSFSTDAREAVIVNEAMVRAQGWQEPIGQPFSVEGGEKVIGVVRDFHVGSLRMGVEPVVFNMGLEQGSKDIFVRIHTRDVFRTVAAIEAAWKEMLPEHPLSLSFLDDQYQALYQSEIRFRNIISVFSALAIGIGCLGLLGLASFAAEQRSKEIGIRKVLGASVYSILQLLSRDFLRLVLLANLIAWPLAWYLMQRWLNDFAYRIDLRLWLFGLPAAAILLLALLVLSLQTLKAAQANPVDSLRNE